jgi:hypothetical protein
VPAGAVCSGFAFGFGFGFGGAFVPTRTIDGSAS